MSDIYDCHGARDQIEIFEVTHHDVIEICISDSEYFLLFFIRNFHVGVMVKSISAKIFFR